MVVLLPSVQQELPKGFGHPHLVAELARDLVGGCECGVWEWVWEWVWAWVWV